MKSGREFDATAHRRAFGDRVRTLRQDRQWTQERLAEEADMDRSYLAGVETGSRRCTIDVIFRLADALEVQPGDLFL